MRFISNNKPDTFTDFLDTGINGFGDDFRDIPNKENRIGYMPVVGIRVAYKSK